MIGLYLGACFAHLLFDVRLPELTFRSRIGGVNRKVDWAQTGHKLLEFAGPVLVQKFAADTDDPKIRKPFPAINFEGRQRISPLCVGKYNPRPLFFLQHLHDLFHTKTGGPALKIIGVGPMRTPFDVLPRRYAHQNILVSPVHHNEASAEQDCIGCHASFFRADEISDEDSHSAEQREEDCDNGGVKQVFIETAQEKNDSGAAGSAYQREYKLGGIPSSKRQPNEAAKEKCEDPGIGRSQVSRRRS